MVRKQLRPIADMLERRDAAALVLPHFFDTNFPQTGNLNPIIIAPIATPSPLNPGSSTAAAIAPYGGWPVPDGDGDADDPIPAPEPPPPPGFPDNIPDPPISGPIGPG